MNTHIRAVIDGIAPMLRENGAGSRFDVWSPPPDDPVRECDDDSSDCIVCTSYSDESMAISETAALFHMSESQDLDHDIKLATARFLALRQGEANDPIH